MKGFPYSLHSCLSNLTLHTLHCKCAVHTNPDQSFSVALTLRLCDVRVIPKHQTHINNEVIILSGTLFCKSCQMSDGATNRQINKQVCWMRSLNPISRTDLCGPHLLCNPDQIRSCVLAPESKQTGTETEHSVKFLWARNPAWEAAPRHPPSLRRITVMCGWWSLIHEYELKG